MNKSIYVLETESKQEKAACFKCLGNQLQTYANTSSLPIIVRLGLRFQPPGSLGVFRQISQKQRLLIVPCNSAIQEPKPVFTSAEA